MFKVSYRITTLEFFAVSLSLLTVIFAACCKSLDYYIAVLGCFASHFLVVLANQKGYGQLVMHVLSLLP